MCGKCYICGSELVWDENAGNCFLTEGIGECNIKEITCMECGTHYTAYVPIDDESDGEDHTPCVGDQGFGNCFECGGTMIWSGDFMRSDFDGELDEKDDSIVRSLVCGGCGCSVEVIEPSENEIRSGKFPHWKGYENF